MNITFLRNADGSPREIIVVTSTGKVLTAAKDSLNWGNIQLAVSANDETALIKAMSIKDTIKDFGVNTPNRGNIEIRGTQVLYRGEPLFGEDVDRIFAYLKNGYPPTSMVAFLEAKTRNKFPNSVSALYNFLENRGMPITDNGTVLGYKGVRGDYFSINTGHEPLIEGTRDDRGGIRNTIGSVVAMDRRYVCDDNSNPCGPGLHIGSKRYATDWAGNGRVMVVEFSPEHVVSVPNCEHEKLRVYRYRVVGELNGAYLGDTYNDEYVRPADAVDPDTITPEPEPVEIVVQPKIDGIRAVVAPDKKMITRYCVSDWSKGQAKGFKDGKAHAKRMYYEEDRGRTFKKYSKEFIEGYLVGYRDGRN